MDEKVFGRRYRVTEKIGTGGMADVYKAQDEVLGRTVAVKVMHPRYAGDAGYAQRFRQEAQAAANLVSPNIVNMYDWGQEESTYYIVMEYVRGTDLKTAIEQRGAIDSRKVADIGAQVCAALSVAHGYDVIHRDIKPHNIMVQPDGTVKVMDFGIARAGNSTMTQTGSVLGTAHYVSPEQAQGRELKAASDLYSLGVVLYEAATGRLPFDADTPVAVALKQVNEQPVPPSAINPGIDAGLETIIMRSLSKNPEQRYSSADEMRRDLRAVAAGRPLSVAAADTAEGLGVAPGAPSRRANQTQVMPQVGAGAAQQGYGGSAPLRRPIPQRRPVWPWLLLGVALVVAGVAIAAAMGLLGAKSAPVPDVTGKSRSEAQQILQDAGFVVGDVKEEFSDKVETGNVITQSPEPNASARKGSAVSLVVSQGTDMVEVPDVLNKPETEAFQILKDAGFDPQPSPDQYNKDVPPGTVFLQSPKGGEKAARGSVVNYTVSKGQETVTVPDVTNKTQAQATSDLTKAGFKVAVKSDYSDTVAKGSVITQSPSGSSLAEKGATVTITVSKGSSSVTVPDVFGLSVKAATDKLAAVGLKAATTYELHNNTGLVLEQDPAAGTTAQVGDTVNLLVDANKP